MTTIDFKDELFTTGFTYNTACQVMKSNYCKLPLTVSINFGLAYQYYYLVFYLTNEIFPGIIFSELLKLVHLKQTKIKLKLFLRLR